MTPEEQRLRNAMRYYLPGSNSSGLKELAADKVSYLSVQRSLLPDLRMGSLPFQDVTVLNLSKNRLGVHAFSSLMYAVAGSASIVELDVSWNMAAADCCAAIAVLLERNTKLKKLVISNNPLTTCIGDDLGRALKTNRTLESLDMESVGLMEGSSLFEGLSGHPALTLLNVNNNTCGPKAWVKFGQAMTAGIKLTSLQARNSDIGSEGAPAVAAAIRSQKVMADIDVSGCKLGSSEAGELLEALSTCTHVRRVVMANNKLKGDVARSLAALCNKANGLEIDLSNCELSDESAKACMASLAGGKRISAFNVSGNNLGETSGAALRTALVKAWKADKRFLKVVYAGNNIEKLFYADVLADDYDDAEGEGAWLPDELDASDSKANAEVLEAVAQMYETGDGKCALKKLRLDGVVLVSAL
jgi:Ran GTPase-activating protein (RanGAP) involved in mRNA processing and transport